MIAALWILYKKSYQKTSSFEETVVNMELKDHTDNSQGHTAPAGKTGPEITSKATVSVPTMFTKTEFCRLFQEEKSITDPGASF